MPVTVVGSANMDLVVGCARIPRPGETLAGTSFATFPGGKGANQAVAAARLGGKVRIIGRVGEDAYGHELLVAGQGYGVDTTDLRQDPKAPTGVALIQVDGAGENTIVVVPGANARVTPSDVASALSGVEGILLTQLEIPHPAVRAALEASGTSTKILNPAPVPDGHQASEANWTQEALLALLPLVDLLTPNEHECEALTGTYPRDDESCQRAGQALLDKGVGAVVITLGAKGSYFYDAQTRRHFPAVEVQPVDTTAAGDAFNGALAHFLSEGKETQRAIELANGVAALSTTRRGAQPSMPTWEEFLAFGAM